MGVNIKVIISKHISLQNNSKHCSLCLFFTKPSNNKSCIHNYIHYVSEFPVTPYFIIDICDVHAVKDVELEVVPQDPPQDVKRNVGPAHRPG